jgi:magnesium-transporting ATPase (P-type)
MKIYNLSNIRIQKFGPNKLEEIKKIHIIYKFHPNFYHFLALLVGAAILLTKVVPQLSIAIIAVIDIKTIFSLRRVVNYI